MSNIHQFFLSNRAWSDYGHFMEVTVTQFKAKCLGIIEKVQREKQRVIISRHGKPAAELIPIQNAQSGTFFGRAQKTTTIKGDLFTSEETWDAEAE